MNQAKALVPTIRFDPSDPAFMRDPYPTFARMREEAPVYYSPESKMWFVFSYDAAADLLREACLGRGDHQVVTGPSNQAPFRELLARWLIFMDPPDHTRLRGLVHKAFSPRIVEQMRADVHRLANELLDAAEAQGQMDLVSDFAYPLPVQVICTLLGIPAADHHLLRQWTEAIALAIDLHEDEARLIQAAQAATATIDYLAGLADERRRHPQNDLLSALLAVEEKGEQLTRDELFGTCALLLMAGHETTANLIVNGVLAMLRQHSQWELLIANPALASAVVEEVMRYDSPVQLVARLVQEEFEYGAFTFEVGQLVNIMLCAAGRDPQRFANPEQLDITRQNIQHFGFGNGIHYCLGAPLARMEAAIAFATLSRRFPQLALPASPLVYRPNASLRALSRLPLTF